MDADVMEARLANIRASAESLHEQICSIEEDNRRMQSRMEDNELLLRSLVKDYRMYSDTTTVRLALKLQETMKDEPQFKHKADDFRFWFNCVTQM